MSFVSVDHAELRRLGHEAFVAMGSGPEEAAIVADHLVEANLKGHDSHGMGLLPMYVDDRLAGHLHANRHPALVREEGVIGVFDAGMGYGHVAAREATDWGIARAQAAGAAIVGLRHAYHLARVGAYGERAAAAGLVGIFFVNVIAGPPKVAPFGGSDGRVLTNPICIAVPGAEGGLPYMLDFATSEIALGKVRVAYNEGRPLREGVLIDATGAPTTDPAVMFEPPIGAVRTFGEHKGSGLAVACELLAAALTGGPANTSPIPERRGVTNNLLAVLIDPARLTDAPLFRSEVAAVLDHVKASRPADPERPVLVAGEPEAATRALRLRDGVPVDEKSWREIGAAAARARSWKP